MSESEGGIEWLLELNAKLTEATQMVKVLNSVEMATRAADIALKQAEKHVSLFGKAVHKGKEWLGEFGKAAVSSFTGMVAAEAAWDSIKEGVHWLKELAGEALHAAGVAQRTRTSFELMMGVQPADDMLEFIDQVAKHSEFTDDSLKDFANSLIKAGYSGEQFKDALAAVNDVASISKDKFAGAGQALSLLERINTKGAISERELAGAGINTKSFFKELSTRTGLGIKDLKEKMSQGKVEAEALRQSFYAAVMGKTGHDLGGGAVIQSKGFLARFDKFKDIPDQIFQSLANSGGLDRISDGLARFTDMLSPDSPVGKKVVTGLTNMLDHFGEFIDRFSDADFDHFGDQIVHAFEIIETAAKATLAILDALITSLNGLRVAANLLSGSREGVEAGSGMDKLLGLADARLSGDKAADDFADAMGGGGWMDKIGRGIGAKLAAGLGIGVKDAKKDVAAATGDLGDAAARGLMSSLDMHSPSRRLRKLGSLAGEGFELGIEDREKKVADAMDSMVSPAGLAPSPGAGGGQTITIGDISIHFGSAPANEGEARGMGREAAVAFRDELLHLLERMQLSGGAA